MQEWSEIRRRAMTFSREWKNEDKERAESQSFWNDFFSIFGINRRRIASFESPVKKLDNNYGFIDLFWKGTLLIEHKSKGEDLDKAYSQALNYFANLKDHELPKYVLVSDFDRFRLHDLDDSETHEFELSKLEENIHLFGFISGHTKKKRINQIPVNNSAAEKMGRLHDALYKSGFKGHQLEVFLVRLLFCLFADDTGIFEKSIFADYIRENTKEDGSDLGGQLETLFQILNTPIDERQQNLNDSLNQFPYINGSLFENAQRVAHFGSDLREKILECTGFNWSDISPAIFGSMFQFAIDPKKRRELCAYYTSEENIFRLIGPLFLDDLRKEFEEVKLIKTNKINRLKEFQNKIANLKFFDPACGCGNFLIVTYRTLRQLEIEILVEIQMVQGYQEELTSIITLDNYYGIEIEEFPARIAVTAMWLTDHQMNIELSKKVDLDRPSTPLTHSLKILHSNALNINWESFAPKSEINYVIGNPPFKGANYQTTKEKADLNKVFHGVSSTGVLDYVSAWFLLAAKYIQGTRIKVAFVTTNSITMGEQVGLLWSELLQKYGLKIHFAHRTYRWNSEIKKSAVHVVIIGFASYDCENKVIYEYPDINGEPIAKKVGKINPYLIDYEDVLVFGRTKPICDVPAIRKGNQPTENGHLILTDDEKSELLNKEPKASKYIKQFMGAREFLYNEKRWCLWLVDASPSQIRAMPEVRKRIEMVKSFREKSTAADTKKNAATPSLFREQNNPKTFLAFPSTTSENRKYIPIGFLGKDIIPSNLLLIAPNAELWHFGVLSSLMHMVWLNNICGRLESRPRYSKKIGYNNFPWPENITASLKARVEIAAKKVLDERTKHKDNNLAEMYDPLAMDIGLVNAHRELDKAVDICYQKNKFKDDIERLEVLLKLHKNYIDRFNSKSI